MKLTELEQLIKTAYESEGKTEDANKVYVAMLRTLFFVPVKKLTPEEEIQLKAMGESFIPLFAQEDNKIFIMIFDNINLLQKWAGEHIDNINYVELLGRDLLEGIHPEVHLCLNAGSHYYKEFLPEEIVRLKTLIAKTKPK